MTTISEDYVSFETAKLLKEKGFDEDCWTWYEDEDYAVESNDDYGYESNTDHISKDFICSRPTLQMACKWLRITHNLFITTLFIDDQDCYGYTIENIIDKQYLATSENTPYQSPEEACDTAIRYCLENLI